MKTRAAAIVAGLVPFAVLVAPATAIGPDVERANELLREVTRTYKELPALTDEMATRFSMTGRSADQTSTIRVRLSKAAVEATGIVETLDVFALDGHLYLKLAGAPGAVKAETGGDPLGCAKSVMGIAYPYLPPQVVLRWAKDVDDVSRSFMLGVLEDPVVAGYELLEVDGVPRHEIRYDAVASLLGGSPGTCRVRVDPQTNLVTSIHIDAADETGDRVMKMTATLAPKIVPRLEHPITVDLPLGVELYENFLAMLSASMGGIDPSIEVGTVAPAFDLVDQDGKRHVSADYRGRIMMLDWWGVW
jgi:hypothetical protein